MVENNVMLFGGESLSVLVHAGHILGLDRAIDRGGSHAEHGNAHAERLDLIEYEE